MDFITAFSLFTKTHGYIAYLVLFIGAYIEIVVPFSFFIPGEIFFYTAGILAASGLLNLWIAGAVLIAGGILGDTTSFFIGKYSASSIERYVHKVRFAEKIYVQGKAFFDRRGNVAVFLARFFGPAAWVTPFFAGTMSMSWKRFAILEPLPAIVAISINVAIGYGIGLGYQALAKLIHQYAILVSAVFVVLAIGIPFAYRHIGKNVVG